MISLFYFDAYKHTHFICENAIKYLYEDDLRQASSFYNELKKNEFLSECWMKRYLFEYQYGIDDYRMSVIRTEYGKPYDERQRIFFNFSTNKKGILAGFSDENSIGVDIEENRKISGPVLKAFFTENDIRYLEEKPEEFILLWTRKEAYTKCLGTGWREKTYLDFSDESLILKNGKYVLRDLKFNNNLLGCACYKESDQEVADVKEITPKDLTRLKVLENYYNHTVYDGA